MANPSAHADPSGIPDTVRALVARPHESLAVELKGWLNPVSAEGQAKIVRAALALRNQNGGYLVMGFDDATHLPAREGRPNDVAATYHSDIIQALISKYCSQIFEIEMFFPEREGLMFSVLQIPAGVMTPVACKADLKFNDSFLLRESDIYVRTLRANGSVSSARASWKDHEELMRRCQDNREADLAAVLGRMIVGVKKEQLATILQSLSQLTSPAHTETATATKVIEAGATRYEAVLKERKVELPPHGSWEIGCTIEGDFPSQRPNRAFLQLLGSANPDLTGWPIWVDSSDFYDPNQRPYVSENHWEAFMFERPDEPNATIQWGHVDFWILDPKGQFYLRRALQDDMRSKKHGKSLETLEPRLVTLRLAEALAVAQSFARAMMADEAKTSLAFAFRWSGLRGRHLVPWGQPGAITIHADAARDDRAESNVNLPLSANEETIARTTHEAVLPLMAIFGGYEPTYPVTKSLVDRLLQRKL